MPFLLQETDFEKIFENSSIQIILLNGNASRLKKATLDIASYLVKTNTPIVLITINDPHITLENKLKNRGVEVRNIIFIDAISRPGREIESEGNCVFVGNPANLTDIAIAIDGAINALPTNQIVLMFDAISILTIYNHMQEVIRFFHFLVSKVRTNQIRGIFLFIKGKKHSTLLGELNQFCDITANI